MSGNGSGTHDTSLRDAVDAAVASNPSAPVKSVHATVIKDPAHSLASVEAVRHHVNNAMARLSAHRRPLAGEPSNATLLGLLEQFLEEDTFAFVKPVGANVPLRLSPRPPGGTSHGDIAAHSFMSIASAGVPVDACVAVLTCRRGLDDLAEVTQVATDEVNNFLQVGEPDAPMLLVTAFPEGRPRLVAVAVSTSRVARTSLSRLRCCAMRCKQSWGATFLQRAFFLTARGRTLRPLRTRGPACATSSFAAGTFSLLQGTRWAKAARIRRRGTAASAVQRMRWRPTSLILSLEPLPSRTPITPRSPSREFVWCTAPTPASERC